MPRVKIEIKSVSRRFVDVPTDGGTVEQEQVIALAEAVNDDPQSGMMLSHPGRFALTCRDAESIALLREAKGKQFWMNLEPVE